MIRDETTDTPTAADAALDALFARRSESQGRRALIYCAFGAFYSGDDSAFIRHVINAIAEKSDWDLILSTGGRLDTQALGTLPENVHVFAWVSQVRALKYADCALVHAGISTLNECIYVGVPMLVYPFKNTTDQMGNAARITYHGLGIVGDRDADDADTIRAHIHHLLEDQTYRRRLNTMREHFERYVREEHGVRVVESLLAESSRGRVT
jgi:MGT family glycosyltransferase